MARIRPFAGWRYAQHGRDLTAVVSPPYDVISPALREELLRRDRHNAVALELPDGPLVSGLAGSRYDHGRETWTEWRETGVVRSDPAPTLYALEQSYEHDGQTVRRRAFIAEVGLEPFNRGVVLPHERTLPKALGDRFELIRATGANFSQVLGLFEDPGQAAGALFDAAMGGEPSVMATDDDGGVSRLWACTDPLIIAALAELLASSRIFIADGHHRYTTALAYRDLRRKEEGVDLELPPGDAAHDYVMMALVSVDDPDLVVLPTHRVVDAVGEFDAAAFKEALSHHFVLEQLGPGHPSAALQSIDEPAFLVQTRDDARPYLARLRPEVDLESAIPLKASSAWKGLDVAVLQELVLDPLLGVHPDRPETLERLRFVKDAHEALRAVGHHDVAFVLRSTRLEQLKAVALAGETMPQKSTYFYPKLLSGLVYRSAD